MQFQTKLLGMYEINHTNHTEKVAESNVCFVSDMLPFILAVI